MSQATAVSDLERSEHSNGTKKVTSYSSDGTNLIIPRVDATTYALETIDYPHHEIHSGSHYFVVSYAELTQNQVLDFTWQMPDTTKWIHWQWSIDTEDEFLWQVYEGVAVNNALANTMTPLNNNRNSANTSGTTMKYEIQADLAAANTDTDVSGGTLLESGKTKPGGFFTPGGSSSGRDNEIVLAQNSVYCLRATSIGTGTNYINFSMQWYEHTNK